MSDIVMDLDVCVWCRFRCVQTSGIKTQKAFGTKYL